MDFLLSFPRILLAILIVNALGTGLSNMVLAIGIWAVPMFARVTRASSLVSSRSEYVLAARCAGLSDGRIIVRHVFPNCVGPLIVTAAITIGAAVLAESGLSFLGLGVPPGTPAWGLMMADGRSVMRSAPHIITFPGLAIVAIVLAFNFVGDALREAIDPALARRAA
jgi:peptide/nickel transport system permease protein